MKDEREELHAAIERARANLMSAAADLRAVYGLLVAMSSPQYPRPGAVLAWGRAQTGAKHALDGLARVAEELEAEEMAAEPAAGADLACYSSAYYGKVLDLVFDALPKANPPVLRGGENEKK